MMNLNAQVENMLNGSTDPGKIPPRKKLLVFVDWYLPGYKAGGQIQSCANLVHALHDALDIYLVTSDRDLYATTPYEGITADEWIKTGEGVHIYYISPRHLRYAVICRVLREVQPDSVYLNSMFSYHFTLVPLQLLLSGKTKAAFFLAPRGMLNKGALQFKRTKKALFLKLFSWFGVHKKITFHATNDTELKDIRRLFGNGVQVAHIGDYHTAQLPGFRPVEKNKGVLKCLFVSRILPMKNPLYLLKHIQKVQAGIELTIIGPVESDTYWNDCLAEIRKMPSNIRVHYIGPLPPQELKAYYTGHHLYVLPTHGENFGHAIFDGFVHGRPVLISDQTPWKNLQEKKLGWSINLDEPEQFVQAIETASAWNQAEFDDYCNNAYAFAKTFMTTSGLRQKYLSLFT